MIEALIYIAIGFGLGWVVCKRPQWVETLIARARDALNRG